MASGIKIPTAIQELIQNKHPNPKVQDHVAPTFLYRYETVSPGRWM
jgi:hypothetical protein